MPQCAYRWPRYISHPSPNTVIRNHPIDRSPYSSRSRSVFFVTTPSTADVSTASSIETSKCDKLIFGTAPQSFLPVAISNASTIASTLNNPAITISFVP